MVLASPRSPESQRSYRRSIALDVNDTASDSPQSVLITGNGTGPAAGFNPSYLTFINQAVGTTSPPQSIVLTNTGTATLNISQIASTVNYFAETNNCNPQVAVGASCTINVTFTPTTTGVQEGAIQVSDDALASPQQVGLTGTAGPGASALTVAPAQLTFGNLPVTKTSASQPVSVASVGAATVNFAKIKLTAPQPCLSKLLTHPKFVGQYCGQIPCLDVSIERLKCPSISTKLMPHRVQEYRPSTKLDQAWMDVRA